MRPVQVFSCPLGFEASCAALVIASRRDKGPVENCYAQTSNFATFVTVSLVISLAR